MYIYVCMYTYRFIACERRVKSDILPKGSMSMPVYMDYHRMLAACERSVCEANYTRSTGVKNYI